MKTILTLIATLTTLASSAAYATLVSTDLTQINIDPKLEEAQQALSGTVIHDTAAHTLTLRLFRGCRPGHNCPTRPLPPYEVTLEVTRMAHNLCGARNYEAVEGSRVSGVYRIISVVEDLGNRCGHTSPIMVTLETGGKSRWTGEYIRTESTFEAKAFQLLGDMPK
jgi:hypothetical protein